MVTLVTRKAHDLIPRQRLRWDDHGFVEVAEVDADWVSVRLTVLDAQGRHSIELPAAQEVQIVVEPPT